MNRLEDAWAWYQAVRRSGAFLSALAGEWDTPPDEEQPWRANRLNDTRSDQLADDAAAITRPLDDLAVLALFAAFEAEVRTYVLAAVAPELDALKHPVARHAAAETKKAIDERSLSRLLEAFKFDRENVSLVEEVSQVRQYRNCISHGRRKPPKHNVTPDAAYDRLLRFLRMMGLRPPVS